MPEVDSDLFFNEQEIEVLKLIKYEKEYHSNTRNGLSLREAILNKIHNDQKIEIPERQDRLLPDSTVNHLLPESCTK